MMKNTFNAMLKNRPKGQKVNEILSFQINGKVSQSDGDKVHICETDSCSILCEL